MSLEDRINEIEITEEEVRIFNQKHENLSRTYSYLIDTYGFAQIAEDNQKIDELHKYLFKETKYDVSGYEFQVNRLGSDAVRYFSEFGENVMSHPEVRERIDIDETDFVEALPSIIADENRFNTVQRAYSLLFQEIQSRDASLSGYLKQNEPSTLFSSSVQKMERSTPLYESRLATKGLINQDGDTPSLTKIVGGTMVLTAGFFWMAQGFGYLDFDDRREKKEKRSVDGDKILQGYATIGGVLLSMG